MAITQADVIQSHLIGSLAQLYTSMPAIVTDVSELEARNVVSVQPAVKKVNSEGLSYEMAIIEDVPVQWPSGGGAILSFPLAVGDDVLIICSMTSIVEWFLLASGTATPFDTRTHDVSDSFVIPSIFREANNPSPSKDNVVLKYSGKSIVLEKSAGDLIISSDTTVIINGDTTLNGNLDVNGTVSASGAISSESTVTALSATTPVGLTTHIHLDPVSGSTSPPTAPS